MKVKVLETAYLDNTVRNPGDVFEWSYNGEKIPPCVEVIGKSENTETKTTATNTNTIRKK